MTEPLITIVEAARQLTDICIRQARSPEELGRARVQAITTLHAAFCAGELRPLVRKPDGDLTTLPIAGDEWRDGGFGYDVVAGGIVKAFPGSPLTPFNGMALLMGADTFAAWMGGYARRIGKQSKAADCQVWLEAEMRASPQKRPRLRAHYQREAKITFGVPRRQFSELWAKAIAATGCTWGQSGAPRGVPRRVPRRLPRRLSR